MKVIAAATIGAAFVPSPGYFGLTNFVVDNGIGQSICDVINPGQFYPSRVIFVCTPAQVKPSVMYDSVILAQGGFQTGDPNAVTQIVFTNYNMGGSGVYVALIGIEVSDLPQVVAPPV